MRDIISNKNLSTFDLSAKRKVAFYSIYNYCIKNKDLPKEEFLSGLYSSVKYNLTEEKLFKFLEYSKRYICCDKALLVGTIIRNKIDGKEIESFTRGNDNRYKFQVSNYSIDKHVKSMEELDTSIDKYIETKKNGEVPKKNTVDLGKVKNAIDELPEERVIDFMMAYFNLNPVTKSEIDELKEVLEFFIANLNGSRDYLLSLDPINDKDKIIDFNVYDEPTDFIKKEIKRYHYWKLKKVENLLLNYNRLYDNLNRLFDKYEIEGIERLSGDTDKAIKKDNKEVYSVYRSLLDSSQVCKTHICGLNNVKDEKIASLKNKFTKKLVLENNVEQ